MRLAPDDRRAGVLAPVFALRTESDLGIGDTTAVRQMIDWCADHGFRLLQLLPINETGPDNSPYNAISAMALDPTTITTTPEALPDLLEKEFSRLAPSSLVESLRSGPVPYRQVKKLKHALLWAAFQQGKDQPELDAFQKANPWVEPYTLFRSLIDENGGRDNWESWPPAHQVPTTIPKPLLKRLAERRRYYAYVQWVAHRQWDAVREHADRHGVALMGDIPFGVSRYSADVWARRALFDLTWSGGAPPEPAFKPDPFTARWGQNWGIPLYQWNAHRDEQYAWWRQRVQQTSRFFHLFRIDHVLGFYRVYAFPWRPQENPTFTDLSERDVRERTGDRLPRFFPHADDTEAHRRFNRDHGAQRLRMIQEAAGATRVVAEDLGVVPAYVRPNLTELGIAGFKIPYWERQADYSFVPAEAYPPLSLVTPATHDHEPLAAHWRQMWQAHEDCRARQDHHGAYVTWLDLQRLVRWTGRDENQVPRGFTPELHAAFCEKLLSSPAWLAIFMVTDVLGAEFRFNVPGPVAESNWTQRLPMRISELENAQTQLFASLIQQTGRGRSAR